MRLESPRPFNEKKLIPPPETAALRRFREMLREPTGPIDLEIGCGVGWHPIRYSRENPDRTLIALERTAEKFRKFQTRVFSHARRSLGLGNLLPVHADAVPWIACFVPDASIDRIFILYPNPSPKNPAARWIRMPFFPLLMKKLRAGGEIRFRTNLPEYAEEVRVYGAGAWGLYPVVDRTFSRSEVPVSDAVTHFERKYLAAGDRCAEIIFQSL